MSTAVADITLIAIAFGAISANALNVYSGVMSFLSTGIRLPLKMRRAIVALGFGSIGFILAVTGLHNAGSDYENFLLVISYWIGPWLGVFFADWVLRRGQRVDGFLFDRKHNPWAGAVAMLIGMGISISLFSNQTEYVGLIAKAASRDRRPDVRGWVRAERAPLLRSSSRSATTSARKRW